MSDTTEARLSRTETVLDDVVVLRTDALLVLDDAVQIRIVRTYMPIEGVMTLVSERTEESR